jgi:hypothetical protein
MNDFFEIIFKVAAPSQNLYRYKHHFAPATYFQFLENQHPKFTSIQTEHYIELVHKVGVWFIMFEIKACEVSEKRSLRL